MLAGNIITAVRRDSRPSRGSDNSKSRDNEGEVTDKGWKIKRRS